MIQGRVLCILLRHRHPREVIFVAVNALGLRLFETMLPLFRGLQVRFSVMPSPRTALTDEEIRQWARENHVDFWPRDGALRQFWHLMVFSDHDKMDVFPPTITKLRVGHGISRSKMVGGVPYRYAPQWCMHRGRVFFSRMFEASEDAAHWAMAYNPALKGRVVAVGDLAADRLLALRSERERLRSEMGYIPNERVVLFQSTFGPSSLMETYGRGVIEALVRLASTGGLKCILQSHPKHWAGPDSTWRDILLSQEGKPGVRILHAGEDWVPAMIASDLAVTDHTSLTLTYSLLGKPILFFQHPDTVHLPGGPFEHLARILPRLSSPENLAADLDRAEREFPASEVAKVTEIILSYPGEAAPRMRRELCKSLNLHAA